MEVQTDPDPDRLHEIVRLRAEVSQLRNRLKELEEERRNSSASKIEVSNSVQDAFTPVPTGYLPASEWRDSGFNEPRNSALTWLWALKNGNNERYAQASGKTADKMPFPAIWGSAIEAIKATQISETLTGNDGEMMVQLDHELSDGSAAQSWIGFREKDGAWQITKLVGYPIAVRAIQIEIPRP